MVAVGEWEKAMELAFTVMSIGGVPIRLLPEKWVHMNACCEDVLATIAQPDYILGGHRRTQIAVREMSGGRYLQVRYRELSSREGFVISAAITSSFHELAVIWRARR